MTRIVFVRHGESTGNEVRRFYGHFDGGLTELGKKQADATGEYLKSYKFDKAYASDLKRAYETGLRIAAYHDGLEVVPDKNLREIYAGVWENMLFDEIAEVYKEEYLVWKHDIWNARPVGGESVQELTERIRDEVWKIAQENDGKTVLLALHATPIRTLSCEWHGIPYEKMAEIYWVKNASVSVVDYDVESHKTSLVLFGEASFMGDMTTSLPKNV